MGTRCESLIQSRVRKMKYFVVESNDISRAGITALLQARGMPVEPSSDYTIISESNGSEAVFLVGLNEQNLPTAVSHLEERARCGGSGKIICISSDPSTEQFDLLSGLGVQGYCTVAVSAETLLLAIRAVETGAVFICPIIHERRLNRARRRKSIISEELSPREKEVLVQLVNGYANSQIAKSLSISVETVKAHVKSILSKLGVNDRTQAVVKAIKAGLIDHDK